MTLFGPTLVAHLPTWPPAATIDHWLFDIADLPQLPTAADARLRVRLLEPLEWVELAARGGATFNTFDYAIIRAAAQQVDEFVSDDGHIVPTKYVFDVLLHACQSWVMSRLPRYQRPVIDVYGIVYRQSSVSWEEQ